MKRTGVLALLLLLASSASAFTFRSRPSPLLRRSTPPLRAEAAEWQDCAGGGGCKVLRPPVGTEPRALVHFLGGAFVSPQPTVAYRHVLESLADRGYVVCATPFAVDFNYRLPCGAIRDDFDVARRALADEYDLSRIPTVSMGHSLGALMHVLLACEYPGEFSLRGAALVSYNNKPVEGAIPLFKEVFVPAFAPLEPLTREPAYAEALEAAQDFRKGAFSALRGAATAARDALNLTPGESLLPGVEPLVLRAIDDAEAAATLVDQIPGVVESISRGASEFEPTPEEMRALIVASSSSSATASCPAPLVVSFSDDGIDESDGLVAVLEERRRLAEEEKDSDSENDTSSSSSSSACCIRRELTGTHLTPLAIDPDAATTPLLPIPAALDSLDLRGALLRDADELVRTVDEYFADVIAAAGSASEGEEAEDESQEEVVEAEGSSPEKDAEARNPWYDAEGDRGSWYDAGVRL